jgi:NAD+ diphosphatase
LGWSPVTGAVPLDRATDLRSDDAALAAAWEDSRTQVLVVGGGGPLTDDAGLLRLGPADAPSGERYLLGRDRDGRHVFAVRAADGASPAPSLREAAGRLRGDDLAQAMHAVALCEWHERHPQCSACGALTEVQQGGYARRCPAGHQHFPRTDPAMIVLVLDGAEPGLDRALLGRQASWPEGRYSTLAGFVEPGETVEDAVEREVAEESGVSITALAYVGSQPWPFPASLMLAFYAVAAPGFTGDGVLRPDGEEIVDVRWFDRDGLAEGLASGEVLVPPALSVARRLIEGWYGGRLRGREVWR